MRPVLVSACLLGLPVRYDGRDKGRKGFLPEDVIPVAVCPEVFGGLPTPRPQSTISGSGGEVLDGAASVKLETGADVTENFIRGAQAALKLAEACGATEAYLKNNSPSCDADFGVAAELLRRAGLKVHRVE